MLLKKKLLLAGGLTAGIAGFCHGQNHHLQVSKVKVALGLAKPIKLIHLSDLHGAAFGRNNNGLYRKIKRLAPDCIVFTGDLIDDNAGNLAEMLSILERLRALAPLYYIPGNHEHRSGLLKEIAQSLTARQVVVLQNELATLSIKGQPVAILGLAEKQGSFGAYQKRKAGVYAYEDHRGLFAALAATEGVKIVLSHFPENFALIGPLSYQQFNFDLMLSGHAHGGQFRVPWIGGLYAPGQGILPKYTAGTHGTKPKLVISRGLGNSGFPLRLFNRPEIGVIKLV